MKWIYNISNANTWKEDGTSGIQKILLRPVWIENELEYTSGIVELRITSLHFIDEIVQQGKFSNEEISFFDTIKNNLNSKYYYVEENDLDKDDLAIYLNRADIYIQQNYNLEQLLQWCKVYFAIKGYPCSSIEETDFDKFTFDVNPILRIFSVENAKKYEDKFGCEWWKNKFPHSSNKALIASLLKQINKN